MNILISYNQYNILLEYERRNSDKQYEEQYNKLKNSFIRYFENVITAYSEDDDSISLYDKDETRLLTYRKKSQELYYNFKINDFMYDFIPHHIWSRHSKYVISDVFNNYFDDPVKYVTPAGMN